MEEVGNGGKIDEEETDVGVIESGNGIGCVVEWRRICPSCDEEEAIKFEFDSVSEGKRLDRCERSAMHVCGRSLSVRKWLRIEETTHDEVLGSGIRSFRSLRS